ncbi:MAG: hypothetical protein RL757_1900 [Bacteroidota bacterium]|jgi:putative redox protein
MKKEVIFKNPKSLSVELVRVAAPFRFDAFGADKTPVAIDAAAAIGGSNAGARPMELLLMGLAGCSAIDVILILKKARQPLEDLRITVEGIREADETPAPFLQIDLKYWFKGNLKPEKVENALQLSMEKYCSATAMLEKTAQINWTYEIEL